MLLFKTMRLEPSQNICTLLRWRSGAVVRASDVDQGVPGSNPGLHISLWPLASHIYLA